jgi:putative endonuclease
MNSPDSPDLIRLLRAQLTAGAAAFAAKRAQRDAEAAARAASTSGIGARSEDRAARLLLDRGYRIVERNFKVKLGELDIVAIDGDTLVFVEVRSRAGDRYGSAIDAIGHKKRQQVSRVAAMYLALRRPTQPRTRFDVVAITAGVPTLIQDAWRLTF